MEYLRTKSRVVELRALAVQSYAVVRAGRYTSPPTFGVYGVDGSKDGCRAFTFHIGNHPVRQEELLRQHGDAELLLLFPTRALAAEAKFLLEKGGVSVEELQRSD